MLKHITISLLFTTGSLAPQAPTHSEPPQRKVAASTIISTSDPSARIQLLNSPVYIGADRWILYGFSNCELHAFVEADTQKRVLRLYWVQFESYLPTRPELHHTYDSLRHAQIGSLDFFVDTWVESTGGHIKPGSDVEHINNLVASRGYKLPSATISVRLVHLLDQQKRKELMFIYSEDLAASGFTASELRSGGRAHGQWPNIEEGLIQRAKMSIAIQTVNP